MNSLRCYESLTTVCIPLLVLDLSEVEETTQLLTSRQLHLLHLFLQHSQHHPCTRPHYRPTPLHTPLAPALSPLLLSITSPSLFMLPGHHCSTLLGLLRVPSPLSSLFQLPSLSLHSPRTISTDSGTTARTCESFLFCHYSLVTMKS